MSTARRKQADKFAAALGQAQTLERPSNIIPDDVKTETQKAVKAEIRKTVKTEGQPDAKPVTVGAKVHPAIAHHWAIQAKIQKRPMARVMTEALTSAFGLPDGFSLDDAE